VLIYMTLRKPKIQQAIFLLTPFQSLKMSHFGMAAAGRHLPALEFSLIKD